MRHHSAILLAVVFLLASNSFAGNTVVLVPTTTLTAESSNNTSAPNSISNSTNGIATSGNISKVPYRSAMYPGATTKIYTTLLGWFGESGHISVGYNSQDPTVVARQIEDMQSRGIDGTFLAWYGADAYEDVTAQALKQESELHPGFNFAIMIDHGTITWDSRGLSATDALIYHMNYIANQYYSSPAYLHVGGRPVVMEFGMELENIDWTVVRSSVQGNPLVIFRNPNGYQRPLSDGAYAWGPDSSTAYLDDFYWNSEQNTGLIAFGGSAKGFNDSLASWSANSFTSEQCGQTWLNSIADANKYYSATNQLPFMMVATWNDYEEGTTIESGVDNCLSISPSSTNQTLAWSVSGQENTLDHYTVFLSTDGQKLMPLTDVPTGTTSLDLTGYTFPAGTYTAYVKAVGKNSLKNNISGPTTFTVDFSIAANPATQTVNRGQASNYSLTLTPSGQLGALVTFACSGLPTGAACVFGSNPLVAGATAATTALAITTSVDSASLMMPRGPRGPGAMFGLSLSTAVFGFFGMGMGALSALKRKQRCKLVLCLLAATLVPVFSSGCGTGAAQLTSQSTAPPQKTFTITVTATSGTTTHSVPLQLTLQ